MLFFAYHKHMYIIGEFIVLAGKREREKPIDLIYGDWSCCSASINLKMNSIVVILKRVEKEREKKGM